MHRSCDIFTPTAVGLTTWRVSMTIPSEGITKLLVAWSNGDQTALEKLTPLIYGELHRLARRYLAQERPGHTLQATALVNEAYLRLVDWKQVQWQNRAHFFGVSAQLMRRILVDHARSRRSTKRGGGACQVALSEAAVTSQGKAMDLITLDDALSALAVIAPRQSQVVELRFFGGLSIKEAAEVLKVSPTTIKHDWSLAQAWL